MEHYYRSIISGERAGAFPAILRAIFAVASILYALLIAARNRLYDRGILKTHRLPVPVISVGNITTGGTGKTPTVILLVKELQRLGFKPAILTRGYGPTHHGRPDEVAVIQTEAPDVPIVVNPDRVAGGRTAIADYGSNILVLDDGFQHRRLHRDLNIVLLDATEPMGIPGVLPRGSWREPPAALARANLLMLTHCDQVSAELADLAAGLLTQWVSPRDIYQQSTVVTGVYDSLGQPVTMTHQRVLAFAGIAHPDGFLETLRSLGLQVAAACWFDDHHDYQLPADFVALEKLTRDKEIEAPVAAWVTTLKDSVKLPAAPTPRAIWHVRIAATLSPRAMEVLDDTLRELRPA